MTDRSGSPKRFPYRLAVPAALAAAAAGAFGIYGIATQQGNPAAAVCRPAVDHARQLAPLVHGEIAAVAVARDPRAVPALTFADQEGRERSLSEWLGRTVLLNLWATWCVPCRQEMPALDALQAKLGGDDFEVVSINIDTRNLDKPRAWLREAGVTRLHYYADPKAKVFQDLKAVGRAFGMPTTLLIDPQGCELAYLAGPAEWASPEAVRLIEAALRRTGQGAATPGAAPAGG